MPDDFEIVREALREGFGNHLEAEDALERAEVEARWLREALNLIASGEYYETAEELAAAALANDAEEEK